MCCMFRARWRRDMVMIFQALWYMCARVDLSLMSIALRACFKSLLCFVLS